ncbi:MAG: AMP-binding protein [Actinobacteria bacterium]|nr:AMP-binding protein [Actinomycetota bacterium]MDA8183131.1 AMP-binding protein [Actinomycetota bacterium]
MAGTVNLASLVDTHPSGQRAFHDGSRWWTWGEVRGCAQAIAASVRDSGIAPGDRVALALPTSPAFAAAYLGVLGVGAVAVPLDVSSPAAERDRNIATAEVALVIDDESSFLGEALAGAPVLQALGALERSADDTAVMLFTSGTGGLPKPAMLTHGSLLANLRQMLAIPGGVVSPGDVALGAIPMSHVFGLNVVLGMTLAAGVPLVCTERFDARGSLALVREHGVTVVTGAPGMFAAWVDLPDRAGDELRGLRLALCGSAPLPPELSREFEERFGVALDQGYGLTEASAAVTSTLGRDLVSGEALTPMQARRRASVGRPLPGIELRLVDTRLVNGASDEDAADAIAGDPGEIWVRGPNVFAGYWRDDAATAEVLTADGWLRTGDVGVLDDAGDLFVVDRLKDLIVVSGFNVYPEEVEKVLESAPGVSEAVVIGSPHPLSGEAVEAVVVARSGASVTEAAVMEHCARHLATYKCPVSIRVADAIPKGPTGKVLRRQLRRSPA